MDKIAEAKRVFALEREALRITENALGEEFEEILQEIVACKGKIIWCGMGKSGHVAGKLAATMASLGTPAFTLNPAEALHGDLGMVSKKDIVILVSHSGESEEIIRLIPSLKLIGSKLIAITSEKDSTLAKECNLIQIMPVVQEACALKLAPTSSTTAVMTYGDALAIIASKMQGFAKENFAILHPAGVLGKKLLIRVSDIMSTGDDMPTIKRGSKITDAIMEMSGKSLGVVVILDVHQRLLGLLTDGDLRRAIEKQIDLYQGIVDSIMTISPKSINADMLAIEALQKLKENSINNFPVVDKDNNLVGVITWQQIVKAGIMI